MQLTILGSSAALSASFEFPTIQNVTSSLINYTICC